MEMLIIGLVMALTIILPVLVAVVALLLPVVVVFTVLCSCGTVPWRVGKIVYIVSGLLFALPLVMGFGLAVLFMHFGRG